MLLAKPQLLLCRATDPGAAPGASRGLRPNRRRAFCRIVRLVPVLFWCPRSNKPAPWRPSVTVVLHPGPGRLEMSTIMKNKSLLLLPLGLAILIVIGILTS